MNNINDLIRHHGHCRPDNDRHYGDCGFRHGWRQAEMPDWFNPIDNFCKPQEPSSESIISGIVEKFTNLLNSALETLSQSLKGLYDMISKQQAQQPSTTPTDTTTPPPANTQPSAPATPPPAAEPPAAQPPCAPPATTTPDTGNAGDAGSKDKVDYKKLGKTGEFLWKPISEKDGKLAILLPSRLTGDVKTVKILDKDGKVIEKGDYSGVGNGDRMHYRFNKPGNKYPDGCIVEITLKNGEKRRITIDETSERFTR